MINTEFKDVVIIPVAYQSIEYNDRYMSLSYETKTGESERLSDYISELIGNESGRTYSVTKKLRMAVAALIADLLSIGNYPANVHLFRPRGVADFKGQRVGYRTCIEALDGLMALDLLHLRPSVWRGSNARGEGLASSYRPKSHLLEIALRFGITPGNWRTHFRLASRPVAMPHPIMVRAKREYWDCDERGTTLPLIKTHPGYIAAAAQVNRINAFMATQEITGCNHTGFIRIFNHGNQPGFDYNLGGRLYSKAAGISYQNAQQFDRYGFAINGERVVELDLRASFLSIYYQRNGLALDPIADPYTLDGLPRDVVKAWIAMTFGHDRFHKAWSPETAQKLLDRDEDPIDLMADYPIERVKAAVLEHHPLLNGWPESGFRWPYLQYLESTAVIDAVEQLAIDYNIAALPLHDAVLIGMPNVDIASNVLARTFENVIGGKPVLKLKDQWRKPKERGNTT